jgi:hypothetical protein
MRSNLTLVKTNRNLSTDKTRSERFNTVKVAEQREIEELIEELRRRELRLQALRMMTGLNY